MITRLLMQMSEQLEILTKTVREVASEQVLLGNRVEDAFARAMRANARLDELEDKAGQP